MVETENSLYPGAAVGSWDPRLACYSDSQGVCLEANTAVATSASCGLDIRRQLGGEAQSPRVGPLYEPTWTMLDDMNALLTGQCQLADIGATFNVSASGQGALLKAGLSLSASALARAAALGRTLTEAPTALPTRHIAGLQADWAALARALEEAGEVPWRGYTDSLDLTAAALAELQTLGRIPDAPDPSLQLLAALGAAAAAAAEQQTGAAADRMAHAAAFALADPVAAQILQRIAFEEADLLAGTWAQAGLLLLVRGLHVQLSAIQADLAASADPVAQSRLLQWARGVDVPLASVTMPAFLARMAAALSHVAVPEVLGPCINTTVARLAALPAWVSQHPVTADGPPAPPHHCPSEPSGNPSLTAPSHYRTPPPRPPQGTSACRLSASLQAAFPSRADAARQWIWPMGPAWQLEGTRLVSANLTNASPAGPGWLLCNMSATANGTADMPPGMAGMVYLAPWRVAQRRVPVTSGAPGLLLGSALPRWVGEGQAACGAGFFMGPEDACEPCPVGSYCLGDDYQRLCHNAPSGAVYTSPQWPNASCPFECPAFTYRDTAGLTCVVTPVGMYSPEGTARLLPCVPPAGAVAAAGLLMRHLGGGNRTADSCPWGPYRGALMPARPGDGLAADWVGLAGGDWTAELWASLQPHPRHVLMAAPRPGDVELGLVAAPGRWGIFMQIDGLSQGRLCLGIGPANGATVCSAAFPMRSPEGAIDQGWHHYAVTGDGSASVVIFHRDGQFLSHSWYDQAALAAAAASGPASDDDAGDGDGLLLGGQDDAALGSVPWRLMPQWPAGAARVAGRWVGRLAEPRLTKGVALPRHLLGWFHSAQLAQARHAPPCPSRPRLRPHPPQLPHALWQAAYCPPLTHRFVAPSADAPTPECLRAPPPLSLTVATALAASSTTTTTSSSSSLAVDYLPLGGPAPLPTGAPPGPGARPGARACGACVCPVGTVMMWRVPGAQSVVLTINGTASLAELELLDQAGDRVPLSAFCRSDRPEDDSRLAGVAPCELLADGATGAGAGLVDVVAGTLRVAFALPSGPVALSQARLWVSTAAGAPVGTWSLALSRRPFDEALLEVAAAPVAIIAQADMALAVETQPGVGLAAVARTDHRAAYPFGGAATTGADEEPRWCVRCPANTTLSSLPRTGLVDCLCTDGMIRTSSGGCAPGLPPAPAPALTVSTSLPEDRSPTEDWYYQAATGADEARVQAELALTEGLPLPAEGAPMPAEFYQQGATTVLIQWPDLEEAGATAGIASFAGAALVARVQALDDNTTAATGSPALVDQAAQTTHRQTEWPSPLTIAPAASATVVAWVEVPGHLPSATRTVRVPLRAASPAPRIDLTGTAALLGPHIVQAVVQGCSPVPPGALRGADGEGEEAEDGGLSGWSSENPLVGAARIWARWSEGTATRTVRLNPFNRTGLPAGRPTPCPATIDDVPSASPFVVHPGQHVCLQAQCVYDPASPWQHALAGDPPVAWMGPTAMLLSPWRCWRFGGQGLLDDLGQAPALADPDAVAKMQAGWSLSAWDGFVAVLTTAPWSYLALGTCVLLATGAVVVWALLWAARRRQRSDARRRADRMAERRQQVAIMRAALADLVAGAEAWRFLVASDSSCEAAGAGGSEAPHIEASAGPLPARVPLRCDRCHTEHPVWRCRDHEPGMQFLCNYCDLLLHGTSRGPPPSPPAHQGEPPPPAGQQVPLPPDEDDDEEDEISGGGEGVARWAKGVAGRVRREPLAPSAHVRARLMYCDLAGCPHRHEEPKEPSEGPRPLPRLMQCTGCFAVMCPECWMAHGGGADHTRAIVLEGCALCGHEEAVLTCPDCPGPGRAYCGECERARHQQRAEWRHRVRWLGLECIRVHPGC
ncbi:hypothetical protein PAPYR_3340 [Paratrimastix pyriformis]|uniref:Uncharacterized protein n=1 Tax=Paratrimastix pyriformis TaxID=342808 RepID=A0ABQ8UMC3_9EUKA|nr:hypothetical protein PAPYR_3340 [Paratrimastix pyriformis]